MSVPPIFPFLVGTLPPLIKERLRPELVSDPEPMIEEEYRPPMRPGLPMGGIGMLQAGQMGPLNRLGQFINQELAEENQGEVDEFIGEVGDMANQRFGVDLGSVGQRPMFNQIARPAVQMYEKGGAAFPDLSGDGKITQKDVGIAQGWLKKDEKTGEVVKTEESSPATKKKSKGSKDACYYKVKSRYKKWPSAYASGALAKCRKVGVANWGNKS